MQYLSKLSGFSFLLVLLFVAGCQSDFEIAANEIAVIEEKYGASLKQTPITIDDSVALIGALVGYSVHNTLPESVESLIDFKLNLLEAEKLSLEGWQWGRKSTTKYGFGCRGSSKIIPGSADLRNRSAHKGYEAIDSLQLFITSFPEEAKTLNLTQRDVLNLKAIYFLEEEEARKDVKLIKRACKDQFNETN